MTGESFGYDRSRFLLARRPHHAGFPGRVRGGGPRAALAEGPALDALGRGRQSRTGHLVDRLAHPLGAEIGAHLTMIHGLLPDAVLPGAWTSFLGAAWSLSTEVQFYAVMALLAPALPGRRGLSRLFLGLAIAALAWRWAAPDGWQFSRAFLPNKAQYFALGVASADWIADVRPRAGARLALVLGATLALSAAQGGMDKIGAPLVWTACLLAQRSLGMGGGEPRVVLARGHAASAASAAVGGDVLLHLPCERAGAEAAVAWLRAGRRGNGVLFTALWIPGAVLLPLGLAGVLHARIEQPALRLWRGLAGRGL
jgi:peptidoglycan/LPS O-acetylase OafA/YrhL